MATNATPWSFVLTGTVLLASTLGLLACDQRPSDVREWKPSDHDHTAQPNTDQVEVSDARPSPMAQLGIDEVGLVTWRQKCVTCHGPVGRGDGPRSAMAKPPDLTDPKWQEQATDQTIISAIQNGRGQMPPFDLPESTIKTLVRLIRLLNRDRLPDAGSSDADTDAAATDADPGAAPSIASSSAAPTPPPSSVAGTPPQGAAPAKTGAAPGTPPRATVTQQAQPASQGNPPSPAPPGP